LACAITPVARRRSSVARKNESICAESGCDQLACPWRTTGSPELYGSKPQFRCHLQRQRKQRSPRPPSLPSVGRLQPHETIMLLRWRQPSAGTSAVRLSHHQPRNVIVLQGHVKPEASSFANVPWYICPNCVCPYWRHARTGCSPYWSWLAVTLPLGNNLHM